MSTKVEIKNIEGPDYIIVNDGDRQTALAPGQSKEIMVCFDTYFSISEADKIYAADD